jgi:acyl-CoA thioester hydrolase
MDPMSYITVREVLDEDIDGLGHASNVAYVRWIQDVAVAHSEAVGLGFAGYQRLGAIFVIRRHEVDYLRPLLRGDRIEVRTWIGSVAAAKCQRLTEIALAETGKIAARAVTTWGFVDVRTGRPTRIPDDVRAAFGTPLRERTAASAE